jgi:lipopolysaccharide transport system ATP-binding protein
MTTPENNGDILLDLRHTGVYYWRKTGFLRKEKYWALRDVSLTLRRGESLGIVGRNGAGKSTLLKMLAGIIKPDSGEMFKADCSTALLALQIGFAEHLTGRENARLSGMLLGLDREVIEEKMDWIMEFSELGNSLSSPLAPTPRA